MRGGQGLPDVRAQQAAVGGADALAAAIDPLTAARAGKELAGLRLLRVVVRAREQGRSQSAIAAKLGLMQPGLHKMLIRAGVTPEVGERTLWEVVLGYAAGEMTRDQMLDTLAGWSWTVATFTGRGR